MWYVDRFCRTLILVLSLVSFTSVPLHAEDGPAAEAAARGDGTARPRTARPWWTEEQIERVDSPLASLEAAVDSMYTSYRFAFEGPYGTSGFEIADYEWEAIRNFIDGVGDYAWARNIPPARRELHLQRFHLSDTRIVAEIIRAKQLGFRRVTFTTDLNDALVLPDGTPKLTDFSQGGYQDTGGGRAIRALRDAGFGYNDERFGIFSNPMTNEERRPLMHEKGLLLLTYAANGTLGRSVGFHGSANLSIHAMRSPEHAEITRYNRMFRTIDPVAIEYDVDHLRRTQAAFAEGKGIHQIEPRAPRLIVYRDGSAQQIGYTDGRYMPNDDLANRITNSDPSYMLLSHFVGITNNNVYKAIEAWVQRNRTATIDSITDSTFVQGWAQILRLDGYDHIRNFGGIGIGVPDHIADRTRMWIWQARIPNVDETELDGAPIARNVWHDKTTYLEEMFERVLMATIWTGSMNLSNNFHNSERQVRYHCRADSALARAVKASVLSVIEGNPQLAIDFPLGLTRLNMARMIGRSELTFPLEAAERILGHMRARRFDQAMAAIRAVAALPNPLRVQLSAEELEGRLTRFRTFVDYHSEQMPHLYGRAGSVGLRKLVTVTQVMGTPSMNPVVARLVLWSVFWDSRDRTNTTLREQRVRHAWGLLFPDSEMPERPQRESEGESTRHTAAAALLGESGTVPLTCSSRTAAAPEDLRALYLSRFL